MKTMKFGIILVFAVLAVVSTVSAFAPISFPYDGKLVVTYVASDAGYNNEFGVLLPGPLSLGKIHGVTPPKVYTEAGICTKDVPVVLYIKADDGYTYRSDANGPDGVDHAKVTAEADTSFTVAFEDLYNGGDKDYNDAVLNVACTPDPINTPEFPTMTLPVVLIIGMLGVVLVIQRTRDE
jgi:hypothetical protein